MSSLTLGVALVTYNGLQYLAEQLESIVHQTRSIEHIVISDDHSTDGTWEFLETWASKAPMRVTLIRNDVQLGLRGNFEQAISAVQTDVIFTADQDDVWVPEKVALMCEIFERDPEVVLIHTDAILIDKAGHDMGKTLFGELGLSQAERAAIHAGDALTVNYRRNVVTGATAAVRNSLVALAVPFPKNIIHDAWLALLAGATGKVRVLDTATIHYRQHGGNLVGIKKMSEWMKFRHLIWSMQGPVAVRDTLKDALVWRQALHERLEGHAQTPRRALDFAANALAFYRHRATLSLNPARRAVTIVADIAAGRYRKYSYTPWGNVLRDLFNK